MNANKCKVSSSLQGLGKATNKWNTFLEILKIGLPTKQSKQQK